MAKIRPSLHMAHSPVLALQVWAPFTGDKNIQLAFIDELCLFRGRADRAVRIMPVQVFERNDRQAQVISV
jgi:hypothetical protein